MLPLNKQDDKNCNFELLKKITVVSAQQVDELIFKFGHLEENSDERIFLTNKIRSILHSWAESICSLGGLPGELWRVSLPTPEGVLSWQYPHSRLVDNPSKSASKNSSESLSV